MNRDADRALVPTIMLDFARLTGLEPAREHPRRYLWTDAFAVCNFLGLFRRENDKKWLDLARSLVEQVHRTLGRHRADDSRRGWISGLDEEEGARHPTKGGLRIGKPRNERRPGEPADERLEWEQDGQYYHYLTKWMHALCRVSRVSGDPKYLGWAMELAKTAHAAFTRPSPAGRTKRMSWKMSIDLTHPLVSSMGQHDPLDGFVTYNELQAAAGDFEGAALPDLKDDIADMAGILQDTGSDLATDDPLGIGGLLFDAWRIAQLMTRGGPNHKRLLENVLEAALWGMKAWAEENSKDAPAEFRLAFRELGLSIGLAGLEDLRKGIEENPLPFGPDGRLRRRIEALLAHAPLRERIERFWQNGQNQKSVTWTEHREINMVMLATSLEPLGFLSI